MEKSTSWGKFAIVTTAEQIISWGSVEGVKAMADSAP